MPSKTEGGRPGPAPERAAGTSVSGNGRSRDGTSAGRAARPLRRRQFWGYRLALRLDYLGLIGTWNFSPRFIWSQDVDGTTPGLGGNFVDGRRGAGPGGVSRLPVTTRVRRQLHDLRRRPLQRADRCDFLAATIKYSF
jgi:hypothetical protein